MTTNTNFNIDQFYILLQQKDSYIDFYEKNKSMITVKHLKKATELVCENGYLNGLIYLYETLYIIPTEKAVCKAIKKRRYHIVQYLHETVHVKFQKAHSLYYAINNRDTQMIDYLLNVVKIKWEWYDISEALGDTKLFYYVMDIIKPDLSDIFDQLDILDNLEIIQYLHEKQRISFGYAQLSRAKDEVFEYIAMRVKFDINSWLYLVETDQLDAVKSFYNKYKDKINTDMIRNVLELARKHDKFAICSFLRQLCFDYNTLFSFARYGTLAQVQAYCEKYKDDIDITTINRMLKDVAEQPKLVDYFTKKLQENVQNSGLFELVKTELMVNEFLNYVKNENIEELKQMNEYRDYITADDIEKAYTIAIMNDKLASIKCIHEDLNWPIPRDVTSLVEHCDHVIDTNIFQYITDVHNKNNKSHVIKID